MREVGGDPRRVQRQHESIIADAGPVEEQAAQLVTEFHQSFVRLCMNSTSAFFATYSSSRIRMFALRLKYLERIPGDSIPILEDFYPLVYGPD